MSTRALKSIIRRYLCGGKSRRFTTRRKALVRLKNRKTSKVFTRKHLKEHAEFWKNAKKKKKNFGQKKPRLFCTRMKGNTWRRRGTASHLSNMMLLCACGTGSLLVIDDVTAAKSRGWILSAEVQQMLQNWSDTAVPQIEPQLKATEARTW